MNGGAWGGSEEQWYKAALWMHQHNYEVAVSVFSWPEKQEKIRALKAAGIKVFEIPNGRGFFKRMQQKRFLKSINFRHYDFVYVNQGGWHDVTHSPFKRLHKELPAYALSFHNYQLRSHQKPSRVKCLSDWIHNAKLTVAATGVIYEMLWEEFSIRPKNAIVSYSPVTFDPPVERVPLPAGTFIFLSLGALDVSRKAQDKLIEAFAAPQWKNRDWRLLIFGEGRDRFLLEDLIQQYKLSGHIFLKGHTSQPADELKKAHILVQATRYDAMPISVMEAMCLGRPCLVSKVGDMPVWVQHGINGFVAESIETDDLQKALEEIWEQRERIDELGENAFGKFKSLYPEPYMEKFVSLLSRCMK